MEAIHFAAIGLQHNHIMDLTAHLVGAGAELVSFYDTDTDYAPAYVTRHPQAHIASSEAEILDDPRIQLVISAAAPCERAPLAIRAMQSGKNFIAVKPAFTSLEQLDAVRAMQAETNRLYSIYYSERLTNRATLKAGELVQGGTIGRVVQTIGLGPHRIGTMARPRWFWDRQLQGGILADLASHQMDQFLYFTGSTQADIISAQVANVNHPSAPQFEDFGDMLVRSPQATGYVRVDWLSPDGLGVWGDARLTILGTEGYIELRKTIDLVGRRGGDHLFLVNQHGTGYIDCAQEPLRYGSQILADVVNRTNTVMSPAHCFLASELALRAQAMARQIAPLPFEVNNHP